MKPIKIPSYDIIAPSINKKLFIGWKYKVHIYQNIYLLIQYVNVPPCLSATIVSEWCFSFCSMDEVSFVSHAFQCAKGQEELGYRAGIDWALKEGEIISQEFASLANNMKLAS